jgi:hypothetical protein
MSKLSIVTGGSKPLLEAGELPRESKRRWTKDEDERLREGVRACGPKSWKKISEDYLSDLRSDVQCLHRWTKVLKPGLVKGPWTDEEDSIILNCVDGGMTKWSDIANCVPGRLGKQCRERWSNHLDPNLKKGNWSLEEDRLLVEAQSVLGNCWSRITKVIQGRSENSIKNRWNSAVRKQRQDENRALLVALDSEEVKKRILELASTSEADEVPVARGYLSPRGGPNESLVEGRTREVPKKGNNRRRTVNSIVPTSQNDQEEEDLLCSKFVKQEEQTRKAGLTKRERQLVKEAFMIGLKHNQQRSQSEQQWQPDIWRQSEEQSRKRRAKPAAVIVAKAVDPATIEFGVQEEPNKGDQQANRATEEPISTTPKQQIELHISELTTVEPDPKRQRTVKSNGESPFNLNNLSALSNTLSSTVLTNLMSSSTPPLKLKLNMASFRPNSSATALTADSFCTSSDEGIAVVSSSADSGEGTSVAMQSSPSLEAVNFNWADLAPLKLEVAGTF